MHYCDVLKIQDDSDSDSDYAQNQIQNILCQMIPIYLDRRQYLHNILTEASSPIIKEQIKRKLGRQKYLSVYQNNINSLRYRLQDYNEKEKNRNYRGQNKKYLRRNLTERLIEKRRQTLKQQKMLEQKYNKQELNAIFNEEEDHQIIQQPSQKYTISINDPLKYHQQIIYPPLNIIPQKQPQLAYPPPKIIPPNQYHKNKEQRIGLTFNNPSPQNQSQLSQSQQSSYQIHANTLQIEQLQSHLKRPSVDANLNQNLKKIQINIPVIGRHHETQEPFQDTLDYISEDGNNKNGQKFTKNIVRNGQDETHSQINYNCRFNKQKKTSGQFDTYSHKPTSPNIRILMEKQKIEKQRKQAQMLKQRVSETLGGYTVEPTSLGDYDLKRSLQKSQFLKDGVIQDMEPKSMMKNNSSSKILKESASRRSILSNAISQNQMQGHYLKTLKYLFSEVCELAALSEIYKFCLQNKQYEILSKLSDNIDSRTIHQKNLQKAIIKLLSLNTQNKESNKNQLQIILNKLFNNKKQITYEEFCGVLAPKIYENQFMYLSAKMNKIKAHKTIEFIEKLFYVWIQIQYFERNIKETIMHNVGYQDMLAGILETVNNPGYIDLGRAQQFIYDHRKCRVNHKKVQIYFQSKFPDLDLNKLLNWGKPQKSKYL